MPVIVSSVVSVYDGDRSEWDTGVAANSHVKTLALIRDKCTDSIRKERNACTLQASEFWFCWHFLPTGCRAVTFRNGHHLHMSITLKLIHSSLTLLGTTINWTTDINYNWECGTVLWKVLNIQYTGKKHCSVYS